MTRNVSASSEEFLSSLSLSRRRMDTAQAEITSGKRVRAASDAPDQVSEILQIRAEISRGERLGINLGRVKSVVDSSESALQSGVKLLEQATVLASRGAGALVSANERLVLLEEVRGLQQQLVDLSATRVEGTLIFSDAADSPAYTLVQAAGSGTFVAAQTAQEIFDRRNVDTTPAPDNVTVALANLAAALAANDAAGMDAALPSLRQAGDRLNQSLAFYGSVQNRIDAEITAARRSELQLRGRLSSLEDADITAAALELSDARLSYETALSARARMPKTSLFDYLG